MDDEAERELAGRHRALIERDQVIGMRAEAEAARAHAARLAAELDVARARLARKNARIEQLVRRVDELEAARPVGLRTRVAGLARVARRRVARGPHTVDEE